MKENIPMTKSSYYIIVGLCATIIMSNSIEIIMKVKDSGLFDLWLSDPNLNIDRIGQTKEEIYSIYLSMCLSVFFIRSITPIALAINSYFSFIKLRVNKLFVSIWVVLLIGLFAFTSIGESYYSVFFILSGVCYASLVCVLLHLGGQINKQKNKDIIKKTQRA
jgi:hypothetical protein